MGPDWKRVEQLFEATCDRDTAARERYLDAHCADDGDLRREVESLLSAHDSSQVDLGAVVVRAGLDVDAPSERGHRVGQSYGPWRLEELIDAGGMGTVYRAVRADDQYRQRVAVKLIRSSIRTAEEEARFLRERQALAQLEHPNIARLIDGGTGEEGAPFLVMEFVDGKPIDRWCDERRVTVSERLELFCTVCDAVQHAHANLLVHRDIKPANVLVTDEGVPKLLDFGIAKVIEPHAAGASTTGQHLTPEYASPEQLQGRPVTTATDVYSLGVLLYQLLCGRKPFEAGTQPTHELARRVMQELPSRPSRTLRRTDRPGPKEIAAARATRPDRLRRQLAGDLDNVVLMALHKEPELRYASAEQLAADIRRHLGGHPVIARPPTLRYVTTKFIGRHHAAVLGVAGVVVALGLGLLGMRQSMAREREQMRLRTELLLLGTAQLEANPYLQQGSPDFDATLAMLDRAGAIALQLDDADRDFKIEYLWALARGYEALDRRSEYRPLVEVILELERTRPEPDELAIARCLHDLGQSAEAHEIRERLLHPPHPDLAEVLMHQAARRRREGDFEGAFALYDQAEAMLLALDPPASSLLSSLLESKSEPLHRLGRSQQALDCVEQALGWAAAEDRPEVRRAWLNHRRGVILHDMARYEEADAAFGEALEALRTELVPGHPMTAKVILDLGLLCKDQGRFDEAEQLLRECLEIWEETPPESQTAWPYVVFSLARLRADRGDWSGAGALGREALELYEVKAGSPDRPDVRTLIGRVLVRTGRADEALTFLEPAHAFQVEHLPPQNWERAKTASVLGDAYTALGRFEEARALLEQSVPIIVADRGPDHYRSAQAWMRLVRFHQAVGDAAEAERCRARITPKAAASPLFR